MGPRRRRAGAGAPETLSAAVSGEVDDTVAGAIPNRKREDMKNDEKKESSIFASCAFSDLGLHPALCDQLRERMGFEVPTQVQAKSIPTILSGRHVLVNAATGTGKTIAYLAPIIHFLQAYNPHIQRSDGTFALVLVPTRELCMQVYEILQKLLHRFHWIVPGYIMGGENRSKEKARLRKGISILVATPGRLLDHLKNTTSFVYTRLLWMIFDEADRILELGFGKEIEEILKLLGSVETGSKENNSSGRKTAEKRQNLLFSATLNEKVNELAKISLESPVMITLEDKIAKNSKHLRLVSADSLNNDRVDVPLSLTATGIPKVECYNLPIQLSQRYVKVPCGSRLTVLLSIIKNMFEKQPSQKVVVFFSTCVAVDFHYSLLCGFKWPADSPGESQNRPYLGCKTYQLHGNMEHDSRKANFQKFNMERSALLLCTDVAARGLDFPKVKCIVQYDSPGEATEYVHRVGRTARLGEKGEAILFLQPIEVDYLVELQKHGVTLDEFPVLKMLESFSTFVHRQYKNKVLTLDMHPWLLHLQKTLEAYVLGEAKLKDLAKDAFWSWVCAYTAHRGELKKIFMVQKLHLGHVARSFGLKEQPSAVGRSFQIKIKKRKRNQKPIETFRKKRSVIR